MQHARFEMSGGSETDASPSLVAPLLALLSLALGGCATPPDAPDGLDAFLGRDSLTLTEAFASERFPNVVVTNDGTVLATFGTTSVRARRSTDEDVQLRIVRLLGAVGGDSGCITTRLRISRDQR